MSEWQKIETAPHDTAILLFFPGSGAYFDDRPTGLTSTIVVGLSRGREDARSWICDIIEHEIGWYDQCYHNPVMIKPTYWMPLPEPPP